MRESSHFLARLTWPRLAFLLCAGYAVLLFWFPLWPYYNQLPQVDVRALAPGLGLGLLYGLWLTLLMIGSWRAYRWLVSRPQSPSLLWFMGWAGLYGLLVLGMFPLNANDVYRYFIRGRVTSVYHDNPFTTAPSAFPDDPYLPLAGEWADYTSPYGPVWEIGAGLITRLWPDNLLVALLAFKAVGLLTFLGSGWLVWGILAELPPGERLGRTVLWLWNPALLLIFVADGHNDGLMLFWLLLGVWLWRRGRVHLAWLVLPLAPLTKLIGLLALPFIFWGMWREQTGWGARLRLFLVAGSTTLALALLAFLPFGSPVDLFLRLVRESREGLGFSPLTLIYFALRGAGLALPTNDLINLLANVGAGMFLMLAVGLGVLTVRGRAPFRAVRDIFLGYTLQALSFRLWYAAWLYPWSLLDSGSTRFRQATFFLLTTQLSVLIYGHLRVYLFGGSHVLAHLIGVPFTFLLPWLVGRADNAHIPHLDTPQIEK